MLFLWWPPHVRENAKSFELALFVLTKVVCYKVQMFLLFYKLISWDHTLFITALLTHRIFGVKPDKYSLVPGFIHAPAGMHLWQFCTHGISRLGNKTNVRYRALFASPDIVHCLCLLQSWNPSSLDVSLQPSSISSIDCVCVWFFFFGVVWLMHSFPVGGFVSNYAQRHPLTN